MPKVEPAPASRRYRRIGVVRQKQQHTRLESTASRAEAPSSEPSSASDPGLNSIIPSTPNPHRPLPTAFLASRYSLTPCICSTFGRTRRRTLLRLFHLPPLSLRRRSDRMGFMCFHRAEKTQAPPPPLPRPLIPGGRGE